jgi:hypothetical protein
VDAAARRLLPLGAAALLLAGSAARGDAEAQPSGSPAPSVRYTVRSDARLERLTVRVCFEGAPPPRLGPGIDRAGRALIDARDAGGRPLPVVDERIVLSRLAPGACLHYRLDLDVALRSARLASRRGGAFLSSPGAWLWRDRRRPPAGGATLRFELPAGLAAATPWPREGAVHRLDASAFQRPSFVVVGRFARLGLARRGVRVEAVRLGDGWSLDDADVRRWLSTAIDGVASVQGRFPVDRLLVVMSPSGGRGMRFGMVRRGGGHSVAFLVGRRSDASDLERSWVGWHELSHLQLPALPQRDAWLYEGLATYYQEVLPARVGLESPREAWDDLLDGFARGARSRARHPLSREAARMRRTGAFQRVYWAGTAFALEADVRLRERGRSLDAAIAHGARAWRGSRRVWSSEAVCRLWDRPLERAVLRPLHARYADRLPFPDTAALLRRLGVRRDGGGVALEPAALSAIRDAIMAR